MADNLSLPQVAAAQNQKEVPINAAAAQLSGALADFKSYNLGSGDGTVLLADFQSYMGFATTGNTIARTLNIPAQKRAVFIVYNGGSHSLSVTVGSTTLSVSAGGFGMFQTDGTTNGLARVLGLSSLQQDLGASIAGQPPASMNILIPFNRSLQFPASLTGSNFVIGTAPTSDMTFTLYKVVAGTPTSIGSIKFAASTGVVTVTFASPVQFDSGNWLLITAPGSQDATGADVGFNFLTNIV